MITCPECKHKFDLVERVCPRLVSVTTARKSLTTFDKDMKQGDSKLMLEMSAIINSKPNGFQFTTNYIARTLGVDWVTNNDKILKVLARLICDGKIRRTEFDVPTDLKPDDSRAGRGHRYEKTIELGCKFMGVNKKNYFKCYCLEFTEAIKNDVQGNTV